MGKCTCIVDIDVYSGDTALVGHVKVVKARVTHVCLECGGIIQIGEQYELNVGLYDDGWSTVKTCAICREIRDCFLCGWYYGCVWSEIEGWFLNDPGEDIGICVLDQLSLAARKKMINWIDERLIS